MNPVVLLGAQALVSLAASTAILAALSRPLAHTLEITCPDRAAAAFWLRYAQTMLVIAPLVLVLVLAMEFVTPAWPAQEKLRFALLASLGSLLFALRAVGKRIGQFVPAAPLSKGAV